MPHQISLDANAPSAMPSDTSLNEPPAIDPQLVIIRSVLEQDRKDRAAAERASQKGNSPKSKRLALTGAAMAKTARPVWSFLARRDLPRYLAMLLLVYLAVMHTGAMAFLAAMAGLLALILYFSLGPDRIRDLAVARYTRLRQHDPIAAERLRERAATVSRALSVIVDRLPESWTRGLYLPDFEEPDADADKWTADPYYRLAKER